MQMGFIFVLQSERVKGAKVEVFSHMQIITDADVNVEIRSASTRCVIRDASGQFVAGYS
jgi:hypothetical protein